jgi:hypothetical protein
MTNDIERVFDGAMERVDHIASRTEWREGGTSTIGASVLGTCSRAVVEIRSRWPISASKLPRLFLIDSLTASQASFTTSIPPKISVPTSSHPSAPTAQQADPYHPLQAPQKG